MKNKILWLDCDPEYLAKGKNELEKSGNLEVQTALTIREAMEKLRSTSFQAVITEYQLHEMDGIAFLKIIRARHRTLPFILFTARDDEEIMKQINDSSFDFYLRKNGDLPDQFRSLINMIVFVYIKRIKYCQRSDKVTLTQDQVRNLPFPVFGVNREGIVCFWNNALEKLTGKDATSMIGKGNYEYALPFTRKREPFLIDAVEQDSPDIKKRYPGIIQEGQTCIFEKKVMDLGWRKETFLKFVAAPFFLNDGLSEGILVAIQDITEFKFATMELKMQFRALQRLLEDTIEVKDLYRTLFENHNAASIVISHDATIVLANNEFARRTGYERQEIEGRMSWTHFMPDMASPDTSWYDHYTGNIRPVKIPVESSIKFRDRSGYYQEVMIRTTMIPGSQKFLVTISDTPGVNQEELAI